MLKFPPLDPSPNPATHEQNPMASHLLKSKGRKSIRCIRSGAGVTGLTTLGERGAFIGKRDLAESNDGFHPWVDLVSSDIKTDFVSAKSRVECMD